MRALDEQLRAEDRGYQARRHDDIEGRVLPGLRYVRDRAMHQVIIGTAQDTRSFFKPRRGVLHIASSYPVWAPIAALPRRDGGHRHPDRETAYEEFVAERGAWKPLFEALAFLTRELEDKTELVDTGEPPWFEGVTVEAASRRTR